MNITKGDEEFIRNIWLPWTGLRAVYIKFSNSQKKWPDIQIELEKIPIITVTPEWRRQDMHERHKRLVHEGLHSLGMEHGKIGRYDYNTIPSKDTYSRMVYRRLIK